MALLEGRYDATTRTLADGEVAPVALTSAGLIKTDAVGGGGGGGAVTIANGDAVPLGSTTGAAVVTDANGTIQQYLRGLVTRWANALGAGTAAAALRVTLASDGPGVAALGTTTGAAVITDADGSIQQYLRGLVARQAAGTLTNRSGTITAGGTSQQLAAANAARRYLFVQNPSTQTESLFVNFTSAALLGTSYELVPGGSLEMAVGSFISTEVVTVIAATTAHPFAAKEG